MCPQKSTIGSLMITQHCNIRFYTDNPMLFAIHSTAKQAFSRSDSAFDYTQISLFIDIYSCRAVRHKVNVIAGHVLTRFFFGFFNI